MGNSALSLITKQDRAILQLKKQRDALKQHQRKLSHSLEHDTSLAKQAVAKNETERAKFYLKLKKQHNGMLSKTLGQLETLEQLISTIEFKLVEKDVMELLQQGNAVLKELNSQVSVDKVDEILDNMEDERVKVDEVTDALGLGAYDVDVDDELEALEREVAPEKAHTEPKLPDAPQLVPQKLPDAPQTNPAQDNPVQENPTRESGRAEAPLPA